MAQRIEVTIDFSLTESAHARLEEMRLADGCRDYTALIRKALWHYDAILVRQRKLRKPKDPKPLKSREALRLVSKRE